MDRNWVIDDCAHPTLLQGLLDPVAAAALGDAVAFTGVGGGAAGVAERLAAGATADAHHELVPACLLYTSPSPRDRTRSRMPSSA